LYDKELSLISRIRAWSSSGWASFGDVLGQEFLALSVHGVELDQEPLRLDAQVVRTAGVVGQGQPAADLRGLVSQHEQRLVGSTVEMELGRLLLIEPPQGPRRELDAASSAADLTEPLLQVQHQGPQLVRVHCWSQVQQAEAGGREVEPPDGIEDPLDVGGWV
jgi:hypothetical protein